MGNIDDIKTRLKQNGGKLVGYARVSTDDQDCAIQIEKLNQLGCHKVYADKSTGKNINRAQLQ
ncbi:MAG: recombinase family protein, partial [Minisyncoccia bacterium]